MICVATLLFWSNSHIIMPVLPKYTLHLGVDGKYIGLINGIFNSSFLIRPFVGKECDRRGRKTVYIIGLILLSIAAFGYGLAPSFFCILLFRFFHGVGWAACSTSSNTIAADLIPAERRGEGISYYGMFSTLAQAGAPALGLSLIETHSYKTVFMVSMTLAVAAILVSLPLKLKTFSCSSVADNAQGPLFDKRAFKVSALMFFLAISYGGLITFTALCADDRGIGNISPFFLVYAFSIMIARLKVGRYYDTKGPTLIIALSMPALFISNVLMACANSLMMFCISGIIFGIGYGSLQPTLLALSVKGIEPERRGTVNGTVMSAFDLGIGIGSTLLGVVANYGGYLIMYMTASLAPLTGLILFLIWNRSGIVKSTDDC
ncbi:MAG: MFS transporter [Tepidanaerobacteraceae bacterium]